MISWEKVVRATGPKGSFVLRLAPEGRDPTMTPATGALLYFVWGKLRLRASRNRAWSVSVRRSDDDPYGPVVVRECYDSRRDAVDALRRIRRALESPGAGGVVEL